MKRKTRIYLDTSVISHLFADDAPEKMADTLSLWDEIVNGRFDVRLSSIVFDELNECTPEKHDALYGKLSEIKFVTLPVDEAVLGLANKVVDLGILRPKSMDDCLHIAAAILQECNYLVSWNFKHLVNVRTINGVRAITNLIGHNPIDIISPSMLIGGELS